MLSQLEMGAAWLVEVARMVVEEEPSRQAVQVYLVEDLVVIYRGRLDGARLTDKEKEEAEEVFMEVVKVPVVVAVHLM
jgi:hypothetical protein